MVKINIPHNFIPERLYIVDIFFNEFLELKYKVEIKKIKDYEIIFNNKKLIIKDYFFSIFKDDLEYLSKKNIPKKVKFTKNHFLVEKDIPIIYGNDELKMNENEIICGVDIFASSFFMLTRWEECVNKIRDIHNRFPVKESLAFNNDFLHRSVVNEYIEMLWNMLKFLGISQKRKEKNFKLILTHDVDYLYKWKSWKYIFRTMGGDILKRNNLKLAMGRINQYKNILQGKEKDPYDTFDWLMDKSESIGIKSRFYFMSRGITRHDNNYKIEEIIPIIKKIKKRGHIIGFHGSYASYNNYQQWRKEKELLESVYQGEITEGRQHFLRFEVPITWQIWEDNNMQIESTCAYVEKEGFRCGTSDEFSTFNVLTRKKLSLKERPLVIMDSTLQNSNYMDLSTDEVLKVFNYYIKITKKYKSKISILWHNSNFDFLGIEPIWRDVYKKVIGF